MDFVTAHSCLASLFEFTNFGCVVSAALYASSVSTQNGHVQLAFFTVAILGNTTRKNRRSQ